MICEKLNCTGCMACWSICGVNAISMVEDEKGFLYPEINKDKCIGCGKCKNKCPLLKEIIGNDNFGKVVKACWVKNENIRLSSTSGGFFSVAAESIINKNGVVFGSKFNDNFEVIHNFGQTLDEIIYFKGSKYVQSYIGKSFRQAKEFLEQGRDVLFTGTPCQIAGLKSYLSKDYENLITLDIVCHGVPSPLVFRDYLKYISNDNIENISKVQFRYKKPSWTVFSMKIDYKDGESYIKDTNKDPYLVGFLSNLFSRECCYDCKFANENRQGDITIGDFWGYISEKKKVKNEEKGISLIIINTEKGSRFFNENEFKFTVIDKTFEEAKDGNRCLAKPYGSNSKKDEFWIDYKKEKFDSIKNKYLNERNIKLKRKISLFFNDHAYVLPTDIRNYIIKLKKQIRG